MDKDVKIELVQRLKEQLKEVDTIFLCNFRGINVDTDTIIPSREIRSTGRTGLAEGMFAPWRYIDVDARLPDPDFALNRRRSSTRFVPACFGSS